MVARQSFAQKLLLVLTDGELVWDEANQDFDWDPTSVLPTILRGQFKREPLHVNLRWARAESELSIRHDRFRAAVLDLAAPLHGRAKDELDGVDLRLHRQTLRTAQIAVCALAALLLAALIGAAIAIRQYNVASMQTLKAEHQAALANRHARGLGARAFLQAAEQTRVTSPDYAIRFGVAAFTLTA